MEFIPVFLCFQWECNLFPSPPSPPSPGNDFKPTNLAGVNIYGDIFLNELRWSPTVFDDISQRKYRLFPKFLQN